VQAISGVAGRVIVAELIFCATLAGCSEGGGHQAVGSRDPQSNGQRARELANEMLTATMETNRELESLEPDKISDDQMFERIRQITHSHVRKMAELGGQFNALPPSEAQAFISTPEAAEHLREMNHQLTQMKRRVEVLTKAIPSSWLGFDDRPAEDLARLLEGVDAWPTERPEHIEAKYGFLRTFFFELSDLTDSQRSVVLDRLSEQRSQALNGDPVATAALNNTLKEVLSVYPKDQAATQYNLGVLYSSLGRDVEAIEWFEKAASKGLPQAEVELARLKRAE